MTNEQKAVVEYYKVGIIPIKYALMGIIDDLDLRDDSYDNSVHFLSDALGSLEDVIAHLDELLK